jgi:serine/threonine-protein kinase
VLGVNGSPFIQMTVFGADGAVLEARGPLRVVTIDRVSRSPVQLLLSNDGLAATSITLSLRPDPPLPQASPAGTPTQPPRPAPEPTMPGRQPLPDPPAASPADPAN